jgi:hypothetical protein
MRKNSHFTRIIILTLFLFLIAKVQAQNIRINEVMSSNSETISDEDETYADWIELYNADSRSINLQDFGLSDNQDNPFKWVFPSIEILPGQYLLIWASGKDRKPETGNLHTNFRIAQEGEDLLLTRNDGVVIDELSAIYIPTDVSYGRLADQYNQWGFFADPTPGAANNTQVYSEVSAPPVISPAGGIFSDAVQVSITSDDPDAEIFYTLDGTRPARNNGTRYSEPFRVSNTRYVRAVSVSDEMLESEISAATFSVAASDIVDFSSNLPVMIIHGFDTAVSPGDRTTAYMHLLDLKEGGRVNLYNSTDFSGRIIVNMRGTSSLSFAKKGYGFHIHEEDGRNRKESLLGMPEEHNWILHGPYVDRTLMRNAVSYSIAADADHYSPRTRFIELFLHTGEGELRKSNYLGVYVLTERIKIAPGRLELEDLEPYHNSYPEITGGYIFKIDREKEGDVVFKTNRESEFQYVRPNQDEITDPQKEYLRNYLNDFESALFGPDYRDPHSGYAAFIDVMSFIDMHLITELTKEIDGYRLSTFFHKDREGKIKSGPLWDFNFSLGLPDYRGGWEPTGWYYERTSESEYMWGWYIRMFQDPAFAKQYNRRYRSLRLTAFSNLNLLGKIADNAKLLEEAQPRNNERWNVIGRQMWPTWYVGDTYEDEVRYMADWLTQRLEWMDEQLGDPYTMIHYWNFNDQDYLLPTYSINQGSISVNTGTTSEILTGDGQGFSGNNARNGSGAGNHLRINNPLGTQVDFNVSSAGFQDVLFSYETRRSGNGANRQYISYTTDGENFMPFDTIHVTQSPSVYYVDFIDVEGANDNPRLAVRISFGYDASDDGGNEGNNRIDNVSVDGDVLSGTIRPPMQVGIFDDYYELIENGEPLTIPMGQYFTHPDGREIQFEGVNASNSIANINFNSSNMVVMPRRRGGEWIDFVVKDGVNPPVKRSIYVLVHPQAVKLSENSFRFNYWSPDEPAGSFPPNMIFLQSEKSDTRLNTPTPFAYHIPADEYSEEDQHNIGFPYRNQTRTRINGLGADGISFINTGRDRDVGSAIVAVDTREAENIEFSWRATTLLRNSRNYHLRLQYRTDISHEWKDWTDADGNVVEYRRSDQGHTNTIADLSFPEDAREQSYVQIRWMYYFAGYQSDEESGARDMLALNMINILNPLAPDVTDSVVILEAYPNPSVFEMVYFNKVIDGDVFDVTGRLVARIVQSDQFPAHHLPRGLYIVRSTEGETVKLVIEER